MKKKYDSRLNEKECHTTPREIYLSRRRLITGAGAIAGSALLPEIATAIEGKKVYADVNKSAFSTDEEQTSYEDATTYNNFYEFGTDKGDPAANAHTLKPRPWSVAVEGECAKPGNYDFEDMLKSLTVEERIYRFRCVEAWSMVIPWVGFELGELLKRFEPNGNAKYVEFETLVDPEQMPGQRSSVLRWPYREGLRIDEAMNPLTLIAVGMYGEVIPNQNGAPLRLVVPWKYGLQKY